MCVCVLPADVAVCHELRNPLHVLKSTISMLLEAPAANSGAEPGSTGEAQSDRSVAVPTPAQASVGPSTGRSMFSLQSVGSSSVVTRSLLPTREQNAQRREIAADVLSAIERMEGTVNDVLDFRKLDANMFVMNRKPTQLLALIDSVCRHCRSFLPRVVEFGYRVTPPEAEVMIDSRRVFQIITNGLRYAPPWAPHDKCGFGRCRVMFPTVACVLYRIRRCD